MSKVYIVDIESVDTRYTCEWKTHVPELLRNSGFEVVSISGPEDIPAATTPGAFLNFGGTNVYKASQIEQIGRLFCEGSILAGDHFIFTDAWHPGIINLKYMSELLGIPVIIHGLWHAGSYDPYDFLGRLIGDAPWVRHTEQALFHAIDHNYFATDFHIRLFAETFNNTAGKKLQSSGKIVRTGWPMEYMPATLAKYKGLAKRDLIIFPHRIAPEKQVDIFRDLAKSMPEYEFVVCQDKKLSKHEYHTLLGESKLLFSASLQETLGISPYEGAVLGVVPLMPDRLSYTEMYDEMYLYPSDWALTYDTYMEHKSEIMLRIKTIMLNYDTMRLYAENKLAPYLLENFFSADKLIDNLRKYNG